MRLAPLARIAHERLFRETDGIVIWQMFKSEPTGRFANSILAMA